MEANGVQLHYDISGQGPPRCSCTACAGAERPGVGQVERLPAEFTCMTYDRHGHGSSSDGTERHSVFAV